MNLLLITGGSHPYDETTPVLKETMEAAGHSVTLSESSEELAGDLSGFDAIVLNTWRRPESGNDLNDAERSGFERWGVAVGAHLCRILP